MECSKAKHQLYFTSKGPIYFSFFKFCSCSDYPITPLGKYLMRDGTVDLICQPFFPVARIK